MGYFYIIWYFYILFYNTPTFKGIHLGLIANKSLQSLYILIKRLSVDYLIICLIIQIKIGIHIHIWIKILPVLIFYLLLYTIYSFLINSDIFNLLVNNISFDLIPFAIYANILPIEFIITPMYSLSGIPFFAVLWISAIY